MLFRSAYVEGFVTLKQVAADGGKLESAQLGFGVSNLFNDYTVDMSGTQGYLSKYSDVRGRQYYLNLKFSF